MHTTEVAEGVEKSKIPPPPKKKKSPWQNKINRKDIRKELFF